MSRGLTFILAWGALSVNACVAILMILMLGNGLSYWWLAPVLGLGLPTVGLILAFLGLLPGTQPPVHVFVRLLPPGSTTLAETEAVPLRSGGYRIISANPGNHPWEFSPGETVHCSEQILPNGEKGLVAVLRA
jgi:hypothetical protein